MKKKHDAELMCDVCILLHTKKEGNAELADYSPRPVKCILQAR